MKPGHVFEKSTFHYKFVLFLLLKVFSLTYLWRDANPDVRLNVADWLNSGTDQCLRFLILNPLLSIIIRLF